MWLLRIVLVVALVACSACTTRIKVPPTAKACADDCLSEHTSCVLECETPGRVEMLDGLRRSLCNDRCRDEYNQCMFKCPGIRH